MTLVRPLLTHLQRRRALGRIAAGALVLASTLALLGSPTARATSVVSVQVEGNQLIDAAGQPFRLIGVDRSGTEYACVEGWGIFDGPSDATSIAAMKAWGIDAVRVPLNEDCWLGINGVDPEWSGANYQAAIEQYVAQLNADGLVAILDLHWSAPGAQPALGQQVMADADHSPAFWASVATAFKTDPGVVLDLYNEPHDISWSCWLNGCTTPAGWRTAGMQSLVEAVRSTGATQPLMVAGLNWAGDLSGWLSHEPIDPLHRLIASVHIYSYSQCDTEACWQATIAPVAQQVPVVTGELGETGCGTGFIDAYMSWADAHGVSYLAWSWNTASCSAGPALITSYNGTPTPYGAGFKAHLATLGLATSSAPTTTASPPTPDLASPTSTGSPSTGRAVPVGLDDLGNLHFPQGRGAPLRPPPPDRAGRSPGPSPSFRAGRGGHVLNGRGPRGPSIALPGRAGVRRREVRRCPTAWATRPARSRSSSRSLRRPGPSPSSGPPGIPARRRTRSPGTSTTRATGSSRSAPVVGPCSASPSVPRSAT